MKDLYTPSDISDLEIETVVANALTYSDAPENWPESSDCEVTFLTHAELRAFIFDEIIISLENGLDQYRGAAMAVSQLINTARLWE